MVYNNSVKVTLIALFVFLLPTALFAVELDFIVMDVGEGQAILLKRNSHGVLIDTGHAGMATRVLQRIKHHGVTQLDYLILTHLHPDHASGYFRIREAFPNTPVLYNNHPLPAEVKPDMVRWVNDALIDDAHRQTFKGGESLLWEDVTIKALWPNRFTNHNLNHHSLVLYIIYGKSRMLIMGDADRLAEIALLEQETVPSNVDVLVVGHHGAADTGNFEFLSQVEPKYSIISVNKFNINGYPHAETLKNLKYNSKNLLRTDTHGEIKLSFVPRPIIKLERHTSHK